MVNNGFIWSYDMVKSQIGSPQESYLNLDSKGQLALQHIDSEDFQGDVIGLGRHRLDPRDFTPKKPGDFGDFTGFNQGKCWFNGIFI